MSLKAFPVLRGVQGQRRRGELGYAFRTPDQLIHHLMAVTIFEASFVLARAGGESVVTE